MIKTSRVQMEIGGTLKLSSTISKYILYVEKGGKISHTVEALDNTCCGYTEEFTGKGSRERRGIKMYGRITLHQAQGIKDERTFAGAHTEWFAGYEWNEGSAAVLCKVSCYDDSCRDAKDLMDVANVPYFINVCPCDERGCYFDKVRRRWTR